MIAAHEYEAPFWNKNQLVMGIDEAGRGPMAGPLVVAGIVLPPNYIHDDVYDSKKISEKKRNALFNVLKKEALFYIIVVVDAKVIDKVNIYQATKQAMQNCTKYYDTACVLTDAMPLDIIDKKVIPIIKGDQKSISIAAASILAKVTRDRIMESYDKIYPNYNFKKHKGYPTKEHKAALIEYGITPIHRKSYEPVRVLLEPTLFDL